MRKKILFVDESLEFGGSVVSLAVLLNHLDKEKYKSIVISEVSEELLSQYFADHVTKYRNPKIINYKSWARVYKYFKSKHRIKSKTFYRILSVVSIFLNLKHSFKLFIILLKEKPGIVHFNNGMHQVGSRLISSCFNLTSFVHQRTLPEVSRYERYLASKTNCFISISNYISYHLRRCDVPLGKIHLFHDPVPRCCDGDSRIAKSRFGIPDGGKCIGIFGRIIEWKGQIVFVRAAIEVILSLPDVWAFVIGDDSDGDGSYFKEIKSIVSDSVVSERIIFTGYTRNTCEYYNIMNLVVHASITPEPFGMVVSEAMSHGLTVIASNEGGPIDMIEDGIDGFLIEPNNVEVLRNKIIEVLSDDELQKSIGDRAKSKAELMFDARRYAAGFEALYDHLCNERE